MKKGSRIYISGHRGLVGSAVMERLEKEGYTNIITRTHGELDLLRQADVEAFFKKERPEYVVLSAARVGGIYANSAYPAQFIYENLMIQNNVIHSSYSSGVEKLVFFGSACSYPRECPQPMKEGYLLTGSLEPTNEPYAVAKIAGMKMCESYNRQYGSSFISIVPANVYGPKDNFDTEGSHVIPALLRRFHEAKLSGVRDVVIWGSGSPKREFIYADDLADACLFLLQKRRAAPLINVGGGAEISVMALAYLIKEIVGFKGAVSFDIARPDGAPQKLLDSTMINALGWKAVTTLGEGIKKTYGWYLNSAWACRTTHA